MSELVRDWRQYLEARDSIETPPSPVSAIDYANDMADEIDRKDAAIAELVGIIKKAREFVRHSTDFRIGNPAAEQMSAVLYYSIAQYDIPKDGAA